MKTKRSQEAYLLIDHRASPGITPEFMRENNLPGPAVGEGSFLESAMFVCKHCHGDVIILDRREDTAWCRDCDAYICDNCAKSEAVRIVLGLPHKTMQQKLIEAFEQNNKSAKLILP